MNLNSKAQRKTLKNSFSANFEFKHEWNQNVKLWHSNIVRAIIRRAKNTLHLTKHHIFIHSFLVFCLTFCLEKEKKNMQMAPQYLCKQAESTH